MIDKLFKAKMSITELLGNKERVKILVLLARANELYLTDIVNKTKSHYRSVVKHLTILKSENLIQETNYKRFKFYKFKDENIKARRLKKLVEVW